MNQNTESLNPESPTGDILVPCEACRQTNAPMHIYVEGPDGLAHQVVRKHPVCPSCNDKFKEAVRHCLQQGIPLKRAKMVIPRAIGGDESTWKARIEKSYRLVKAARKELNTRERTRSRHAKRKKRAPKQHGKNKKRK